MIRVAEALTGGVLLFLTGGCENRQAFHKPDPTLARMLQQRRADPYAASSSFADGKTMQDPPPGTMARDEPDPDAPRPAITRELLARGRARFETICATCHGIAGDGVSVVATKMRSRPPPSLHEPRIAALPASKVFDVVTLGYGWMPSYADMLTAEERWAVVAYVGALQLSQHANVGALPPRVRDELARETP